MTDERTVKLKFALRAHAALIIEAQMEIERYLTKEIESTAFIDRLFRLLDGPAQRESQRLAHEALGEDFGNNA